MIETRKRRILLQQSLKNEKIDKNNDNRQLIINKGNDQSIEKTVGIYRSDLPTYTIDQVSQHSEM